MNKLITKILDNYYTQKFINSLEADILCNYVVLFKAESNHGDIDIYLKPSRSENYTFICSFKKSDSLECLMRERKKFLNFIGKVINDNYENGTWR